MQRAILVLGLLVGLPPLALSAQDWPNWRGPHHDGSAAATGLPTDFSKNDKVVWKAALPGPGAATPIIHGDHVYVSSTDMDASKLLAFCFDRETGEELWAVEVGTGYLPGQKKGSATQLHERSNYASPSPVTDGERVVFFFGNGDLVCLSPDGEKLWVRNLQKDYGDFAFQWTFSASPTLWEGRLYLPILQRDQPANGFGKEGAASYLLGMDPESGETLFKAERPSQARMESLESYATAIPYQGTTDKKELLVVGGDVITGHDPATGAELWRWGTWNEGHREQWWRVVPSPVVGGGVVLACAPKRAPVYAVRLGGEGILTNEALAWNSSGRRNPVSSDVPTPLFYEKSFYVLSDVAAALSKVDPETGEIAWTIDMPGKSRWRASPTGADGKIWCMNHAGDVVVVVDAAEGKLLAQVAMGEEDDDQIRSSIAVAHGRLFVRTNTTLYCLGN